MSTCVSQPVLRLKYLRVLQSATSTYSKQNYESTRSFSLGTFLPRISVDVADDALKSYQDENFKAKKHPGVVFRGKVCLPKEFVDAAKTILTRNNVRSVSDDAEKFERYLRSRKLPIEDAEYRKISTKIESKVAAQDAIMEPFLNAAQLKALQDKRFSQTKLALKKSVYHWESVNYTGSKILEQLMIRSAAEYAALYKIFSEIAKRDPDFQPASLLDFGSGIGTVQWAANALWSNSLKEHLCVDSSRDMSDIAELILRGGSPNKQMVFPNTFYRQFLPTTHTRRYDLVTSAYSLMELPSAKSRIEIINTLWRKSAKYIVIVEYGSNSGFKLINEARDFILRLDRPTKMDKNCHAFSPCPHDTYCPRFEEQSRPCNFYVDYRALVPFGKEMLKQEKYTYVVIKRGPRDPNDPNWPRLVDRPLRRARHVICRACMPDGKLSEIVLTKTKNLVDLYKSGRKSRKGDMLPVKELHLKEGGTETERLATGDGDEVADDSQYSDDDDDSDFETDDEVVNDEQSQEPLSKTLTTSSQQPQESPSKDQDETPIPSKNPSS